MALVRMLRSLFAVLALLSKHWQLTPEAKGRVRRLTEGSGTFLALGVTWVFSAAVIFNAFRWCWG
jgi:hypothetical protein